MCPLGLVTLALTLAACNKDAATTTSPTACETDADCRVSCIVTDRCCEACDCKHPYHRDDLEAVRATHQKQCGDERCHRSCPMPTTSWTARCREQRCVAEEVAASTPSIAPPPSSTRIAASRGTQPSDF